ncbi:MAG: chorismate mutase [Acidobacteriia bacterium]|nr:chorismate mutase [Terriglobia bacterium]
MPVSLARWRGQIDAIDRKLLQLLNQRVQLALELGRRKRAAGIALRDPRREAAILARMRDRNPGPLPAAAVQRLFRAILAESRRVAARAFARPRAAGKRARA